MSEVGIAVVVLCSVSAVCAAILVIAARYMFVPVDETAEKIRACLPGANCGACGYAGCDHYAAEIAAGNEEKTGKCVPGGEKAAAEIAALLGKEAEEVVSMVAVMHCQGDCHTASVKEEYKGISSCAGANLLFGGKKLCTFACLGFGDCATVCPQGAITIKDDLAHINASECIGCGMCADICPKGIISLLPDTVRTVEGCRNTLAGSHVRPACKAGCIGCHKCEKECPTGAITIKNNLSIIDQHKCINCGHCTEVCPTKAIVEGDFTSLLTFRRVG
ncbi:MAG: RnfABCDGE type electron transport complex subunit B [Lachnospiraceae bacterium]|nr:RnfABCDGE type electron transport complex subunit B [Lachnospiraceae bacterium]MBR3165575.1 RnfABCDGE type electron transport complex subunit B [Lachnospiraceae bacterium]